MNKVILIGRLTADPEINETQSGVKVCRFTLAINRPYQQNGETQADFLNVVAWRQAAENCAKFLNKGKQCAVIGSVQVRNYKDSDGNKRYVTEIVAERVEFLGAKQQGEHNYGEPPPEPKRRPAIDELEPIEEHDLPF